MSQAQKLIINQKMLADILASIDEVGSHGSVEIIVTERRVTQITVRSIKKPDYSETNQVYNLN